MSPRRSPGDGSLFKRKADGLWCGRVEIPSTDGKRRYRQVARKDRNAAIAELKKLRSEVDAGRIPVTGKTTVEAWLGARADEVARLADDLLVITDAS